MEKPLKQKTAALRRQHILQAAARRFAETGYQRTTIRDIATEAGVADGTIYNSFANKAELLLALLDPLQERMPDGEGGRIPTLAEGPEAIAELLRDRWAVLTPDALDLLRVVMSEGLVDRAVGEAFVARILGPAIQPLEKALIEARVQDAPLAARCAVAAFLGLAVLRMLGDPVLEAAGDDVPDRAAAIIGGLLGQGGEVT